MAQDGIIDIGADLPTLDGIPKPELELEGLTKGEANIEAIIASHYHRRPYWNVQ